VLTTFDRYLLKRYLHAFVILFVSTYGLFVVIDGFTNVDAFQEGQDAAGQVLRWMAEYYGFQAIDFFDRIAAILSVIAMMVAFALLQKNGELQPILAAGVPIYRLVLPIAVGAAAVNTVVICNEELVIPRVAAHLNSNRAEDKQATYSVKPRYDYKTQIHIDGKSLNLESECINQAEFILPPLLVPELTTLKGEEAVYLEADGDHPAGWLLRKCTTKFEQLPLTDVGRKYVRRTNSPTELFIVSDVSIDQLSTRSKDFRFLSTAELVRRIRNPSTGLSSIRSQRLFFHTRLVKPFLNVIAVFIIIPLVVRRESRSLILNVALCTLVLGVLYGVTQSFAFLGEKNLIAPDFAAWCPAIISAASGAWLSGLVQT
jgi:lipopolysaccharide export system permease protein